MKVIFMSSITKFLFLFLFSFSLFSTSNSQMDDFFLLQKQKKSLNRDINLIYLTYSLGYPEKSRQNLYLLLDKFTKPEFDQNIKEIYETLNTKGYNKDILNSMHSLINKIDPVKPFDKETILIYKEKVKMHSHASQREDKKSAKNEKKEMKKVTNNKIKKSKSSELTEMAIVASEWLDDFDMKNSIKYSILLKSDPYYNQIAVYLDYLKNKNIKPLEKINQKSPSYYHFLIYAYKEKKDNEKALFYFNKLKQEFPYYLKYNKIEL